MRILLLNQVFHPDVAATAQHAHDLGRHLVAHGHSVNVISSRSIYGSKGATLAKRETVDGIEVRRVGRSFFGKAGIIGRVFDFGWFVLAALVQAFRAPRADVVLCLTTPPYISLIGWMLRVFRRVPYVYWAMDLYPDVLVAHGMLGERRISTRMMERLNRFCMSHAARVVVLGRCMLDRVKAKGIDPAKIVHIGVWSDHDEIGHISRQANPYLAQWDVGQRLLIMYSGNIGIVHDVQTMCEAARTLEGDDRFAFAFVGEGKRKKEIEAFVAEHKLRATIAPYQPRNQLDALLSAADVHLVTLKEGFQGIVVPSKLFGVMAAGKPAIFIGPPSSEVGRVLLERDCGIVIAPGDSDALVNALRGLADDPARARRMGENARLALRDHYDCEHACTAWRLLLEHVAAGQSRTAAPIGR